MDDQPTPFDPLAGITLGELVSAEHLQLHWNWGAQIGSTRVARWAHSTELINPSGYLKGGDLVCTIGVALTSPAACVELVTALVECKAAALCFGVGDVHQQIPDALHRACVARGLPLLEAPRGAPFEAVTEFFAHHQLSAHDRDAQDRYRWQHAGRLIMMVADGIAAPRSLASLLAEIGLQSPSLVASAWPPDTAHQLEESLPGSLVGQTLSATVALTDSAKTVLTAAEETGLVCGYGSARALNDIGRSITLALAALRLAERRRCTVGPGQLTTFEGLLSELEPARLAPFVDELVEPITAIDRREHSTYLSTLYTFIQHNGRFQETADACYMHVNTLRKRLERIHAMTGRDVLDFHDRAAFAIALWAHSQSQLRTGQPDDRQAL